MEFTTSGISTLETMSNVFNGMAVLSFWPKSNDGGDSPPAAGMEAHHFGLEFVDKDQALHEAGHIAVHVPPFESTRHLIGAANLQRVRGQQKREVDGGSRKRGGRFAGPPSNQSG
jgi:hypothetical protein